MSVSSSIFDIGAVDTNGVFIFHSYASGSFLTSSISLWSIEKNDDVVYFITGSGSTVNILTINSSSNAIIGRTNL